MKYFKTSAYKGDGIEEMMNYVMDQVYYKKLKAEFDTEKLNNAAKESQSFSITA
jgi:putative protein kinase ArgK-like GTPase of G3E family